MWCRGAVRCAPALAVFALPRQPLRCEEHPKSTASPGSLWSLRADGGAAMGNPFSQVPPANARQLLACCGTDPPPAGTGTKELLDLLSSGSLESHAITKLELDLVLQLRDEEDGRWDLVKDAGNITVHRHKDRSLFQGCFFCKMKAHLPRSPKELTTHCSMNYEDRLLWDKQVVESRTCMGPAGNEAMYLVYRASPLRDRDFSVFQLTAFHEDGEATLIYQRYAQEALFPQTPRAVRGRIYINLSEVRSDGAGGSYFYTVTVVDPNVPLMPRWFTNLFIPGELRQWAANLEKRCDAMLALGLPSELPCSKAFTEMRS